LICLYHRQSKDIPQTTKHIDESIPKLTIRENGVEKLLQDINLSKASGPDFPERFVVVGFQPS
jgi:hypothetical protein